MILHAAHHALEGLVLSKEQLRFNRLVADELAQIIYDGLWFSALSRDLRTYAMSLAAGRVRRRPDPPRPRQGRRRRAARSPLSLYDKDLATYDEGDAFDHAAAVGFIEIFGLPLRVEAARHGAVGKHHGAAWTWTRAAARGPADDRRGGRGRRGGLTGRPRRRPRASRGAMPARGRCRMPYGDGA